MKMKTKEDIMTSETGNKVYGRLRLIKNEATYMWDKVRT